jgi:hypothetical protein
MNLEIRKSAEAEKGREKTADGRRMCGEGAPVHGLMPIIDHDVLFADIAAGDPDDPNDDFTFGMMAEEGTGICGPDHSLICVYCDNGTPWCPCNDPQTHHAKKTLENCLNQASASLGNCIAGVVAAAHLAAVLCAPAGALFVLCIAVAMAGMTIGIALCLDAHDNNVQACRNQYRIDIAALAAEACAE